MKYLISLLTLAVALAGCSGQDDNGDVAAAQAAIKNGPKTPDQLPANMPPQARAAATAAMQQAAAQQQQAGDPARLRAMQEMQKQRGQ